MPWTRRQVRYLESSGSPLTAAQKDKMNAELHANPALGHMKKGSVEMKKPSQPPFHKTHITHHDDGSHTVEHEAHMKPRKGSPAFMEREDGDSYSAEDGPSLLSKLEQKLKIERHGKGGGGAAEPPEPMEREDADEEE